MRLTFTEATIYVDGATVCASVSELKLPDSCELIAEELRALDAQLAAEIPLANADRRHEMFLVKLCAQLRRLADRADELDRRYILQGGA